MSTSEKTKRININYMLLGSVGCVQLHIHNKVVVRNLSALLHTLLNPFLRDCAWLWQALVT